jgi:hypothetical protein
MAKKKRTGKLNIKIKKSKQGSLRAATGTPKGKKIPMSTLNRLKKSGSPAMRKKATFAKNARSWGHR